jgi:hypothetical protein
LYEYPITKKENLFLLNHTLTLKYFYKLVYSFLLSFKKKMKAIFFSIL